MNLDWMRRMTLKQLLLAYAALMLYTGLISSLSCIIYAELTT